MENFLQATEPHTSILVVDHNQEELSFIKDQLKSNGFEVLTATNAISALSRFILYRPHLVFLEITLPGIDGFEALKKMQFQAKQLHHRARFIMLTEIKTRAEIVRSIKYGAHDYIAKPITRESLIEKLQKNLLELEVRL